MIIEKTPLLGALLLQPQAFCDQRGRFERVFCQHELAAAGVDAHIVQVNHSLTRAVGAIRGLHYQRPPQAEGKFVTCIRGSVFDVIVDLRRDSATFLHWYGVTLSAESAHVLYAPPGCAHGFQVLRQDSELLYLHTAYYTPELEGGVRYDDPLLNIPWPTVPRDLSERDTRHPLLSRDFLGLDAPPGPIRQTTP